MSLVNGDNAEFETAFLDRLERSRGWESRYIPSFVTGEDSLSMYQQLLRDRSRQPDIYEIDIIWPPLLANDLVDLSPYLGENAKAFPSELIQSFTISGRLVGIPVFVDTGLLYYRPDLLGKYGFPKPPETWNELENMAAVIQAGERRSGKKDFWGFVWQGEASEALTCNGLEWQSSAGGGHILEGDHTIHVCNPRAVRALERAVSWIGAISPPGVVAYDEDDSENVWMAGNAAFMRNWLDVYGAIRDPSCPIHDKFAVAPMPGGAGGRRSTLGGVAMAVSKYSNHRAEAIAAICELTSEAAQAFRAGQIGSVPTRSMLYRRPEVMQQTPFFGSLGEQVMTGAVARPSALAGKEYQAVSSAYFNALHSALVREVPPRAALERLEDQLVKLTGFRPDRN